MIEHAPMVRRNSWGRALLVAVLAGGCAALISWGQHQPLPGYQAMALVTDAR
jgi:ferric-dicitrate binding protein FerR (iron transport regulator)